MSTHPSVSECHCSANVAHGECGTYPTVTYTTIERICRIHDSQIYDSRANVAHIRQSGPDSGLDLTALPPPSGFSLFARKQIAQPGFAANIHPCATTAAVLENDWATLVRWTVFVWEDSGSFLLVSLWGKGLVFV